MSDAVAQQPLRLRLKRVREQLGMSVSEMATALGVEKSSYYYYELKYKKDSLPATIVERLAQILVERGKSPESAFELLPQSASKLTALGLRVVTDTIDPHNFVRLIGQSDPDLSRARGVLSAVTTAFEAGEFGLAGQGAKILARQCADLEERRERLRQESVSASDRAKDDQT